MRKFLLAISTITILLLAGCSGGAAGDSDQDAKEGGSTWDEMVWDKGKWG